LNTDIEKTIFVYLSNDVIGIVTQYFMIIVQGWELIHVRIGRKENFAKMKM